MDPSWVLDKMSQVAALGPHLFYPIPTQHTHSSCCSSSCPYQSGSIALCHLFSPWMVMGLEGRDIWSQTHASWVAFSCLLSPLWPSFCSSSHCKKFPHTFLSSPLPSPCPPSPQVIPITLFPFLIDPSHLPGPLNFFTSVSCHRGSHSESLLWYLWQEPNKAFPLLTFFLRLLCSEKLAG